MSVSLMSAVFKRSKSKGSARLVLLALADIASDDGEASAYARGYAVLASKANVHRDTVKSCIKELIALGELQQTVAGNGRQRSNYLLTLPEEAAQQDPPRPVAQPPAANEGAAVDGPSGGVQDPPGMGSEHTPPGVSDTPQGMGSETHTISPSSYVPAPSLSIVAREASANGGVLTVPFDTFWSIYPRKVGKRTARHAFASALKRAPAPEIVDGAIAYRDWSSRDPAFTCHPTTWLNRDGWADELIDRRPATKVDSNRRRLVDGVLNAGSGPTFEERVAGAGGLPQVASGARVSDIIPTSAREVG